MSMSFAVLQEEILSSDFNTLYLGIRFVICELKDEFLILRRLDWRERNMGDFAMRRFMLIEMRLEGY